MQSGQYNSPHTHEGVLTKDPRHVTWTLIIPGFAARIDQWDTLPNSEFQAVVRTWVASELFIVSGMTCWVFITSDTKLCVCTGISVEKCSLFGKQTQNKLLTTSVKQLVRGLKGLLDVLCTKVLLRSSRISIHWQTVNHLLSNCYIKMCSLSWSPVVRSRLKVLQIFHVNARRMAGPSCKGWA